MENMPSEVAFHLFTFCFVHKSTTLLLNQKILGGLKNRED